MSHSSVLAALKAYGAPVPAWCTAFGVDKRQEMLAAIQDATQTAVFIIDTSSPTEVIWNRRTTISL